MDVPELNQSKRLPSEGDIEAADNWIVALREAPPARRWPALPWGELLHGRYERLRKSAGEGPGVMVTELPDDRGTRVALAVLDPGASTFELLGRGRRLVAAHAEHRPARVGLVVAGFAPRQGERVADALLAALLAGAGTMPDFRRSPPERKPLEAIRLYGLAPPHRFRRTFAEARGNHLARYLTALPPNQLTPAMYRKRVAELAREHGWRSEFHGIAQLEKKRAGAFLAVTQASPERDAGIMRVSFEPGGRRRTGRLALVGKGICYDTGGINVKTPRHMLGMHEDMAGSAVALGTMLALAQLRVPFAVDCWLALATNHIGPAAYKPNDVVRALDGTTIEVIHSDAEGRMVLADTLVMASRTGPDLVVDYATLTGSCVNALGKAYSGAFTNRPALHGAIRRAGQASGERVWPFPMDPDYDEALESQVADVKQCPEEGTADHILGARFLRRFVQGEVPWLHLDLSSASRKGGLAHVPTDVTGFGVRFTVNLLLDQKAMG